MRIILISMPEVPSGMQRNFTDDEPKPVEAALSAYVTDVQALFASREPTVSGCESEEQADRLLAATIYLMSCHARSHCPRVACMVEHHLRLIGRHLGTTDRVRDVAQKLAAAWAAIRRHDERLAVQRVAERDAKLH